MSSSQFVHLHCHSHYSLLDGAARIPDLVRRTKELGMDSLALTDHGNLYGAVEFYRTARQEGIKPIIGYEAYVAPAHRTERSKSDGEVAYHLTLLAKNQQGYRNLIRMASAAYLEGFYYKPRIDKELLEECHEGIICLSGCASAEFSSLILKDRNEEAFELAQWYQHLFGEGNFYVEIQDNGLGIQKQCKEVAVDIAAKLSIPLVATCDTHYLTADDAHAHDVLLCINTGKVMSDTNRMRMDSSEFYLRSPEEMYERFADVPESVSNTAELAKLCDLEIDFKARHFPSFECPMNKTADQYLRELCEQGMRELYPDPVPEVVVQRLEHELGIICRMGFASYFLIVWEFVNFARNKGIRAGARGSGCGALVSYVLRLSYVDPIEYDLLFERFLDPNRAEAPDIDIDFCQERRDEVIQYVREKYGEENVAQIGTFGTMAARAVVRDVGRALNVPLPIVDRVAKLIPAGPPAVSLTEALDQSQELRALVNGDQQIGELLALGQRLEGLARHAGTHAAGVVIADQPLYEYVPLQRIGRKDAGSAEPAITTQWPMADIEKVGMLKMDFLGLRNLTVLDKALQRIEETRGERIDLETIPLQDEATFDLIQRGDTKGVFQLEAAVVRDILCKMKPDCFRDIIAVNALNRPATLSAGMVDVYINRKHGREDATYEHDVLRDVLGETHGVMVYQEQVMRILNRLGGIELSSAYACIKAISKKKPDIIARNKEQFLQGAQDRGLTEKQAEAIFELIVAFGGYGFNKSHSTAYALIAYQTAYLKTHYTSEFMAALLSSEMGVTDKLVEHIDDCKKMGIKVLPPNINRSDVEFVVEGNDIRFGLGAIKGVGSSGLNTLITVRRRGEFEGIFDLYQRIEPKQLSRATTESLIKAGALDCLDAKRSQLMSTLSKAIQAGVEREKDLISGQGNLFEALDEDGPSLDRSNLLPDIPEWPENEKLAAEKSVLGFYVSGHPLDPQESMLRTYSSHQLGETGSLPDQTEVVVGGMMSSVRFVMTKRPTRNGNSRMARFTFEDLAATMSCVMFPDALAPQSEWVADDTICFLQARVDRSREEASLMVDKIVPMEKVAECFTKSMTVRLNSSIHSRTTLEHLNGVLRCFPGPTRVLFEIKTEQGTQVALRADDSLLIRACEDLTEQIESLIGPNLIRFSGNGG